MSQNEKLRAKKSSSFSTPLSPVLAARRKSVVASAVSALLSKSPQRISRRRSSNVTAP
jgi:hypothetical protein